MNSIFKAFVVSLLMVAQVHFAYCQNAAILPNAMTTYVDKNGKPLTSGTVDYYIPNTSTRKATWQDAAATILNTNPVVLDAAGRALILGNGAYRQVVKDRLGNVQWDRVTNSAGAGGDSTVTVGDGLSVGTVLSWSGFVAPPNYAFAYGQEVSRTTYSTLFTKVTLNQNITCVSSSATITGVADTSQLNIGGAVEAVCIPAGATILSKTVNTVTLTANATVSTTTNGVFFPWGNGNGLTTFNIPDLRGVVLPGRNNMGGSTSASLSNPYYNDPNSIAGAGGAQNYTILKSNLPAYTPTGVNTGGAASFVFNTIANGATTGAATLVNGILPSGAGTTVNTVFTQPTFTGTAVDNGGIAVSATVAAGGSGYSVGTQLLTLVGGTCTTQPQFNVTGAAGVITAPVLVTAGSCSVIPTNPVATTGGGGTAGTLNVTWAARPFSLIQPSKTMNTIIKILPDVSMSLASCAQLSDAGTACTRNVGTAGATVPLLNTANTFSALQTFNAGVNISGGTTTITNLAAPTVASDAANKSYVDSVATGLKILAQSKYATAAILPNSPTYSNGASGVGATLTAGANSTLTVDGAVAALNDVVLVKNQASAFQNGVYTLTQVGSGAAPWILTRATYFDQAAEMLAGSYTLITAGATNTGSSFILQSTITTVGTDALTWLLFTIGGGTVTSVGLTNTYGLTVTGSPITNSGNLNAELNISRLTNSLGSNVALNNTANYFTGPTVAQGTTGTWFASGTVTVTDSSASAAFYCRLWDGTTVISSASGYTGSGTQRIAIALSGFIVSPVGNIRIDCKDVTTVNGSMEFNVTGNSKDSTLTVIRLQ